ncbi:MAG: hypothetical protein RR505_15515, partial [Raoultibacter sp.]
MADDKQHTECLDDRIAPSPEVKTQAVEQTDNTATDTSADSVQSVASEAAPQKPTRRNATIGSILLACVVLIALVVGLNYSAIASLGESDAFKTTAQNADQKQQASRAQGDTSDEKKDAPEKEAEKAAD